MALTEWGEEAPLDPDELYEGQQAELEFHVISKLFHQRIEQSLKVVSLKAWGAPDLPRKARELRHVVASEGIEKVIDELRRAPALAALEGGMIAIEVVPHAAPEQTHIHWQQGMSVDFEQRMYSAASLGDPARVVQARLPVGTAFDLRDAAHQQELAASPVYTSIYDTLDNSWTSLILERRPEATWLLTCWHQIQGAHHRLFLRTALRRLADPLRTAFTQLGLFGDQREASSSPLPLPDPQRPSSARRRRYVKGARLVKTGRVYVDKTEHATIGALNNQSALIDILPSSLDDLSVEQLKAERARLRALLEPIESRLQEHLGFSRAVPVRTFSAQAVSLVEGLEHDPRPVVIYVSGTHRSCLLKPADPDDLPSETILISKLGQHASPLVKRVWEGGVSGAVRVGIWRGGKRNGRTVAELCSANDDCSVYISVLSRSDKK